MLFLILKLLARKVKTCYNMFLELRKRHKQETQLMSINPSQDSRCRCCRNPLELFKMWFHEKS